MNVYLYKVGRNLNRIIRTAYSFGFTKLYLVDCDTSYLKGGLFSAAEKVELIIAKLPIPDNTLVLEINGDSKLQDIDIQLITNVIIGGENVNLSKKMGEFSAKIETTNNLCLTAESAFSIFCYDYFQKL